MSADKDIQFQAPVEMQVANELAKRYKGSLIHPNQGGKNSKYDFQIFRPLGVEVKCDYKAKQTRNLYFEVFNCYRKEPSGLSASTAWMWVHYIPGDACAYCYCPKKMLGWLKDESGIPLREGCGDNNSNGYVVPVKTVATLPFVNTIQIML
jgi:hypothetical protein